MNISKRYIWEKGSKAPSIRDSGTFPTTLFKELTYYIPVQKEFNPERDRLILYNLKKAIEQSNSDGASKNSSKYLGECKVVGTIGNELNSSDMDYGSIVYCTVNGNGYKGVTKEGYYNSETGNFEILHTPDLAISRSIHFYDGVLKAVLSPDFSLSEYSKTDVSCKLEIHGGYLCVVVNSRILDDIPDDWISNSLPLDILTMIDVSVDDWHIQNSEFVTSSNSEAYPLCSENADRNGHYYLYVEQDYPVEGILVDDYHLRNEPMYMLSVGASNRYGTVNWKYQYGFSESSMDQYSQDSPIEDMHVFESSYFGEDVEKMYLSISVYDGLGYETEPYKKIIPILDSPPVLPPPPPSGIQVATDYIVLGNPFDVVIEKANGYEEKAFKYVFERREDSEEWTVVQESESLEYKEDALSFRNSKTQEVTYRACSVDRNGTKSDYVTSKAIPSFLNYGTEVIFPNNYTMYPYVGSGDSDSEIEIVFIGNKIEPFEASFKLSFIGTSEPNGMLSDLIDVGAAVITFETFEAILRISDSEEATAAVNGLEYAYRGPLILNSEVTISVDTSKLPESESNSWCILVVLFGKVGEYKNMVSIGTVYVFSGQQFPIPDGGFILQFQDHKKNPLFPVTKAQATFLKDGRNLEDVIKDIESKLSK